MSVVTRFPPSPTGYLHIGGARTALFNWLYARKHGGKFVFRLEDTDRERSTQAAVNAILDSMQWLGLDWDDGPSYQSQRDERYAAVLGDLLAQGRAYRCYCSRDRLRALREAQMARKEKPRYDGRCRDMERPPQDASPPVVRLRTPRDDAIVVEDVVHGRIAFANEELDDLIIARSDGSPTYHLTVVVDDLDNGVTHVIRGDDHLNNTPRQIHIIDALGGARPSYAHVPMIHGSDGKKLSKRHGALSVTQYRDEGYLPEALLNYLVRLGWSHGDQEIFSRSEMIAAFELSGINKSAASFDPEKLRWVNQQYLQTTDVAQLAAAARPYFERADLGDDGPEIAALIDAQRTRAMTLLELVENSRPYFGARVTLDPQAARKHLKPAVLPVLRALQNALASIDNWSGEAAHAAVVATAKKLELKLGKVAQPLRVAVTGRAASPPIDVTLALLGKKRTLMRLDAALNDIQSGADGF